MKKITLLALLTVLAWHVSAQDFITRDGKKLKFKGEEIYLRGMAFGNLVWDDRFSPESHHNELDYRRLKSLGMNAIRFYLSYKTFENNANPYNYKEAGWSWLDKNIQWAKNNGIYLILNMHVPQGGYQSQCQGDTLWTNSEKQKRLAALWKAIAEKYKNEPQIAGYDILNEPTPKHSIQEWTELAQGIIDSIRKVDQNHLIITERAIALDCSYGYADENNNYPQINEENLMYTVHLYDPYEFTTQNLEWANTGDGGKYPDENVITAPSDATYSTGNYTNPSIGTGTTPWRYFEGNPYQVMHDSLIIGRVVFFSRKIGEGKVYFSDFELKEFDGEGNELNTTKVNLQPGTLWWWSENATGTYTEETDPNPDAFAISVTGNTGNASLTVPKYTFAAKKGHYYVISGWMKGENIPLDAGAGITTEFHYSPSGAKPGLRNYSFLKNKIVSYAKYIEDKGYPVYFGEFGAARTAFVDDKGGERWVADALHVFDSLGYHFTYHSYKESSFGYYDGWDQPVDTTTVNKELETVFRNFFGTTPTGLNDTYFSSGEAVSVYPNPVSSILQVTCAGASEVSGIEIIDLYGTVVLKANRVPVNVSSLNSGSYLLRVNFSGGTLYRKLLKN